MSERHGGDIIGARLAARGIKALYTLCGGHISPILVGAEKHGVRIVDVRDEKHAVFAADATARMTGLPGVAAVTAGPGLTNTVTAVKNAEMAQVPLLILGGATATVLRGRGSLQDIDQIALMTPVTKWSTRVTTVKALGPTIDKALEVAMEGVPGPVFVEVPVDLLYPKEVVRSWYLKEAGLDNPKTLPEKGLELAVKGYLGRQFHQPHVEVDLDLPRPDMSMFGDSFEAQVAKVSKALSGAKKPVLVVGSQALVNMLPGQADDLAKAIESLGIPTFLGGTARGLLGRFSPVQFRHKRSAALKKADVVIVAGFPFDFRLGYGRSINKKCTLVSANLSAEDLKKNRRPDIAVQHHPGEFLNALARTAKPGQWDSWFDEIRKREDERDAQIVEQGAEPTNDGLINPLDFFLKMEEQMADDAVLVVDGGDWVATAAYILRPRAPLSWLDPGVFGTLGVGGGFAVGAGVAKPGKECWIIWGDGSSAYSLSEFDTFARHGLAPIAVVGNDASWAQIARDQVEILGTPLGTVLERTEYHKVAEGYGGVGLLLTKPQDIDKTIAKAKKLAAQGKPVLINVHIGGSDFRKGSISI
ncbi:thiamine pyrophosphate-binding protein [Microvenator marinus]|uniref:Thiamine pyrophosphate-binding protein n=1 Tax=Microvenator marinus TaxID=2600177 RepID=A0A5B8XXE0_9DELT|nr:thiamine pyrophosphate-binding protein [Microvenator marinus]QED29867.1 thiamine pyrophosphate-binding protein [Microvenator marinus]